MSRFPVGMNKGARFYIQYTTNDVFPSQLFSESFLFTFSQGIINIWLWYCSIILNQMEIFCAPAEMRGRRVSKISKPQYKRILNHFIKQCVKNRMFVILLSCILLPSLDSDFAIQTKFIQAQFSQLHKCCHARVRRVRSSFFQCPTMFRE